MHQDTEKYLKSLILEDFPERMAGNFIVPFADCMKFLHLAYNLGYNHGYLAVDEKMIPSEFLQKRVDNPSET